MAYNVGIQHPEVFGFVSICYQEEKEGSTIEVQKASDCITTSEAYSSPDCVMHRQNKSISSHIISVSRPQKMSNNHSIMPVSTPITFLSMIYSILTTLSGYDETLQLPSWSDESDFVAWCTKDNASSPAKASGTQHYILNCRHLKKCRKEDKLSKELDKKLCRKTVKVPPQSRKGRKSTNNKRTNQMMKDNTRYALD